MSRDSAPVVEVEGLTKTYGALRAVAGVSFSVARGEVVALLGPNGAGKTTTVEILEGHRPRTSGSVRVLGMDPGGGGRELRERVGIVLQDAGFEDEFTVLELVRLHAGFYPRRYDPGEMIELVGLADKRGARIKGLSGGQRRRLDLALGLIGAPELLFLDEPTTGFDPGARRRAWELIGGLRELGTTILLTTHYMEEAQYLADRAVVLRAGRIVAEGPPSLLTGADGAQEVLEFTPPPGVGADELPALHGRPEHDGERVRVRTARAVEDLHTLTGWALERGHPLPDLTLTRPSLEDVYLELTGGEAAT